MPETREITWDPEADRRIKRSPFLMRRFIRKRIEDRVASRGRTHVTEADVDESASMYRQYRFKEAYVSGGVREPPLHESPQTISGPESRSYGERPPTRSADL
jgi:hypothetical protein